MGTDVSIKLRAPIDSDEKKLIPSALTLAERIEKVASLYVENSQISYLNEHGSLYPASPHLISMINTAREISEATDGAFDISVQPLWELATTLATRRVRSEAVEELWSTARSKVDYRAVEVDGEAVRFTKPGMKITLNGIAQGYVTEQITNLLKKRGAVHGLVDFGEYQAFGKNLDNKPWRVGIQNPINVMDTAEVVELRDQALATSAANAGQISEQLSHIFDARNGREVGSKPAFASASVIHPSATLADAYATAFTLMSEPDIRRIVKSHTGMRAILIKHDGGVLRI